MNGTDIDMTTATDESPAAFMALMASGVLWGLIWWPLQFFAQAGLTSTVISLTAYALVAMVSLPVLWRERRHWRGEWGCLLLIALCFGCANYAFTAAMMTGSVVRAMLLFYLLPAWGAIGGRVFLGERLGPRRILAVALSLAGVAVILSGSDVWQSSFSSADLLALGAGLSYAAAGLANRKARQIPMASRVLAPFAGCALLALAGTLFMPVVLPALSPAIWGLLVAFAFVWLLGATLMTTYGVTHVPAGRASVLQVIELLVAVVSAVLLGGERLSARDWGGAVLIIGATLIEARSTG